MMLRVAVVRVLLSFGERGVYAQEQRSKALA